MSLKSFLHPDWPAPAGVKSLITTRQGGFSRAPYASFNLSRNVGDDTRAVARNHGLLADELRDRPVQWLQQVHGSQVLRVAAALPSGGVSGTDSKLSAISKGTPGPVASFSAVSGIDSRLSAALPQADGLYTRRTGLVCAVLTADCLPVFLCSADGEEIALAHAGWRGLAAGVLENCLAQFSAPREDILAYLGPAIGPCHFEVGEEVRQAFLETRDLQQRSKIPSHGTEAGRDDEASLPGRQAQAALNGAKAESEGLSPARRRQVEAAFTAGKRPGKWLADLFQLARLRLSWAGLKRISGGGACTYCDAKHCYSHRRDGLSGRFASLIWKTP